METPIFVAVIGGVVTIIGFVISGLFGVLASTSQREAAASLGVEKALNERLKGKDDRISYLEKQVEDLEKDLAEAEEECREKDERISKLGLDIYQCERDKRALEKKLGENP